MISSVRQTLPRIPLTRGQTRKIFFVCATILVSSIFTSLWLNHDRLSEIYEKVRVGEKAPRYAFATLLADHSDSQEDREDWSLDNYFVATRVLAYQLLHHPKTRSKPNIPYIVGVFPGYSEAKRERLRKDGVTVIEIEPIYVDWIQPGRSTWDVVMSKLRFWELEEYDRICLLDGDGMLNRPLDSIFDDPAVALQTTGEKMDEIAYKEDEGLPPGTYAFASTPHTAIEHGFPATDENNDYPHLNYIDAGIMIFRPDKQLFDYYLKVLSFPYRFNSAFPEQNFLNYTHRLDGNMPWKTINNTWSVHFPTTRDIEGGVAFIHDKFWGPSYGEIQPWLVAWKSRMEGYYEAKDEAMSK